MGSHQDEENDQAPFLPTELEMEDRSGISSDADYTPSALRSRRRRTWFSSPVWLFTSFALLLLLLFQTAYLYTASGYDSGFKTDLAHLRPHINLHKTRFAGAIRNSADGNSMHVPEPSVDRQGRLYAGPPTPEIDEAWHDLIFGRYVHFTDSEIDWMNSDPGIPQLTPLSPKMTSIIHTDGYYGGPDMLHSLHCINGLRKHLDMDYYKDSMDIPAEYRRMHIDHCIEQLRQAVMCHADMTPVTLKPVRNSEGRVWALLGETERMHTCRNGEELARVWQEEGLRRGRVESE